MADYTVTIPPEEVMRRRQLAELLRPDHSCVGSGGIGYSKDGSMTIYHRDCDGCTRQRERVYAAYPDLVPQTIYSSRKFRAQELLAKIENDGHWPSNNDWLDWLREIAQ